MRLFHYSRQLNEWAFNMPKLNGFEYQREINSMPIAVITAFSLDTILWPIGYLIYRKNKKVEA